MRSACIALLLVTATVCPAQTSSPNFVETLTDTSWVNCWGKGTKNGWQPFGSRFGRSPAVVSPDGRFEAYAEVIAEAIRGEYDDCRNTTKLFVAEKGKSPAVVFVQGPEPPVDGNSIKVVGWSPDSRLLVAHLIRWNYASEGWSNELILYNASTRAIRRIDLAEVFGRFAGRSCTPYGRTLAVRSHHEIVYEVNEPTDDPTEEEVPCVAHSSRFVIDTDKLSVTVLKK